MPFRTPAFGSCAKAIETCLREPNPAADVADGDQRRESEANGGKFVKINCDLHLLTLIVSGGATDHRVYISVSRLGRQPEFDEPLTQPATGELECERF
jgi:hypothetical protein